MITLDQALELIVVIRSFVFFRLITSNSRSSIESTIMTSLKGKIVDNFCCYYYRLTSLASM